MALAEKPGPGPVVVMETSEGTMMIMLDEKKAPKSVENFLRYVDEGFYNGTVFHRVISGFMIQGGGFDENMRRKDTHEAITNEANNGLENLRGTIAMARTPQVDSATSQFFINTVDNSFLNYRDSSDRGFGYAVFGRVIRGMDVADRIEGVKTNARNNMPLKNVVIEKVFRYKDK
ncbi:peptidylprolyl isomerase [Desulfobaculum bizertense]|nr:peptidylprolyl isomerase [Desulfobaculum bizertense]